MSVKVKHISITDLQVLFEDFGYEVRDRVYDKIEYNVWKRLNTLIKNCLNSIEYLDNTIDIEWHEYNGDIYIKKEFGVSPSCTGIFEFADNDNSFGEWLYLSLFDNNDTLEDKCDMRLTWLPNSVGLTVQTPDASSYNWNTIDTNTTIETYSNFDDRIREAVKEEVNSILNNNKKEEVKSMKGFNFDFGPVSSDVRMSLYGLAVKNASGTYVAYDKANKNIMDVDIFNFEGSKFLYKMPVAIKSIKAGDVVVHARKPMFVLNVNNDNTLRVVDPIGGEKKDILLTKSPFGFDFATKVVNFLDNMGVNTAAANEDNPFGNMWMFALLGDGKMDKDTLLPLMLMNQNGGNINPMMAFALMGDKGGNNDLLTMFALSGMMNGNGCGCNCHEAKQSANN